MAEMESAKLISYVKIDFSTEAELELYVNMFEKEGESFWLQLKEIGLLRLILSVSGVPTTLTILGWGMALPA